MFHTVGATNRRIPETLVKPGCDPKEICEWKGIVCDEKLVRTVAWKEMEDFYLQSMDWLPATIRKVHLRLVPVLTPIKTRHLPRELKYLYLCDCDFPISPIDLQGLPIHLEELHMRACMITGDVLLASLPPYLRVIDLTFNDIQKVYVLNSKLPETLVQVHLAKLFKKPKIVCLDEKKADPRVRFTRAECRSRYRNECDDIIVKQRER